MDSVKHPQKAAHDPCRRPPEPYWGHIQKKKPHRHEKFSPTFLNLLRSLGPRHCSWEPGHPGLPKPCRPQPRKQISDNHKSSSINNEFYMYKLNIVGSPLLPRRLTYPRNGKQRRIGVTSLSVWVTRHLKLVHIILDICQKILLRWKNPKSSKAI